MRIRNIAIFLLILTLSCGCSAKDPQEKLKNRGYSYTEESFVRAVKSGDLEVAKLYLDAGMNVDSGEASNPYEGAYRRTVLHVAAESGQPKIAKLLIDNGANVNARDNRGRQPLLSASFAGSKEIVELLVSHGAEINPAEKEPPSTPLLTAIGRGHYEVAKYLISKGADVLVISQSGYTALHAASASGNPQVVELVISSNIDVNAKTKDGVTPLRLAAQAHDITDIAASLINHGADVNIPDQDGRTALNWAVTMHHTKTVELLLQHGADVNIVDNLGMTALHWAILLDGNSEPKQLASYKTVQLLLSKGARIDVVDKQGRTPSTIAKRKEIVSLLHMASSGDRAREAIALIEPNDTRKHVVTIGDKKIFLDEIKPRASSTNDVRRFNDEQKLLLIRVIWSPLRDVYIHENQIQSTDNEAVDFLAELERPDQSQLIKQEEVINDIKRRLAVPNNQPAIIKKLNEELLRGEYQLTRYKQLMLFSHNQIKKEMGQLTNFHLQIGHKMVRNWKFDKSVYERYGGKIYFSKSKAVGEPLDSYKKFIGEMERRGIIKFYDEATKDAVYRYLTVPDDSLKTLTEIYYSKPNWYWMELYKGQ